ncbi:MAG: DUF1109 domain-containing protein [Burkholderiales bacterium]
MENIENLIDKLAQDAAAIPPAPHPYMLSLKWMAWATGYLFLSLLFSGLRPDLMVKLHQPLFVAEIVTLTGIFISTSISAALLSFPDMHQMRQLATAPVIAFALFVLVMLLAWLADRPPAPSPVHSVECTASITLFSVLPAAWTFLSIRKLASTHTRLAGCIALLSAFSVGALWLRLYETNDSIMHVVEWHYLPMIGVGAAGLWLGKKLLAW